MNTYTKIVASVGMLFLLPTLAFAAQAPSNITVTKNSVKPTPRLVTWQLTNDAKQGNVKNDHIEVAVSKRDGVTLCTYKLAPKATAVTIKKKTCNKEYKAYGRYTVSVTEVRSDESTSDTAEEDFVTNPPRVKNLKVAIPVVHFMSGLLDITLSWDMPVHWPETDKVRYMIVSTDDPSTILKGDTLTIAEKRRTIIRDLNFPGDGEYKFRVRVLSDEFGKGRWSKWKKFSRYSE